MDDRKLPFLEHLRELRIRLRNAVIALLIACAITLWLGQPLFTLLMRPLGEAWAAAFPGTKLNLGYASLTEPFWVFFELSLYAGIFLASPVIFHQLWKFIAPGLYQKEKRIAVPFAFFSGLMFVTGALFCYFLILPAAFRFFLSYSNENIARIREIFGLVDVQVAGPMGIRPQLFMSQYLDLTSKTLLGFGLVFELPLLIFFLSYAGVVTHRKLWKFNKYWMILAFLIGGLLTPPDVISQLLMAGPLIILYNISILIAYVITRRKERAAADAGTPTPG